MKDMPPPKQWPSGDRFFLEDVLGPPDLVVRAKPFTMPAQSPDVHVETEVPLPLTEARWVRASETKPSLKGRRIAHHADAFLIRPRRRKPSPPSGRRAPDSLAPRPCSNSGGA